MLQWLVLVAEIVLWPWQDTKIHTCPHQTALPPSHLRSVPSVINSLFCSSQHPSASALLLLSTACLSPSPFPAWCAVKTAVKHSLISPAISPGNPNEKILPTFSFSCHTAHHKCWQETAVPSLTFYRALRTHTYTHHSYYWQCLWISRVWGGVEEFNDTMSLQF